MNLSESIIGQSSGFQCYPVSSIELQHERADLQAAYKKQQEEYESKVNHLENELKQAWKEKQGNNEQASFNSSQSHISITLLSSVPGPLGPQLSNKLYHTSKSLPDSCIEQVVQSCFFTEVY